MSATAPTPLEMTSASFSQLIDGYRKELEAHCARMLPPTEDPEDLVQESLLRAWRARGGFRGKDGRSLRAWLYRIATNVCYDALARGKRRAAEPREPHLAEYPAVLESAIDRIESTDPGPDEQVSADETIELLLLEAVRLPQRQRAALFLRDLAGLSARETATVLETSVPAANSALQRARRQIRESLPGERLDWRRRPEVGENERDLVRQLIHDIDAGALAGIG